MKLVVLTSIYAILLSHLQAAIIQDTIQQDQQFAEAFWIESISR